jgi:hypothetical protein
MRVSQHRAPIQSVALSLGPDDLLVVPGHARAAAMDALFASDGDVLSLPNAVLDSLLAVRHWTLPACCQCPLFVLLAALSFFVLRVFVLAEHATV